MKNGGNKCCVINFVQCMYIMWFFMLCNFLGPFYLIKTLPALYQQIWCYIYISTKMKKRSALQEYIICYKQEIKNIQTCLRDWRRQRAVTFVHSLSPVCNKKVFLECRLFFLHFLDFLFRIYKVECNAKTHNSKVAISHLSSKPQWCGQGSWTQTMGPMQHTAAIWLIWQT